jgi:hypothetical protein
LNTAFYFPLGLLDAVLFILLKAVDMCRVCKIGDFLDFEAIVLRTLLKLKF